MNIANKITASRALLGILIMILMYLNNFYAYFLAIILFVVAVLTDYYDGIIASKLNQITTFGKFMDPIADKILIIAPLAALADLKLIPVWMVFLIFIREIMMMALRSLAAAKGKILGANKFGKVKGAIQYGAILFSLMVLASEKYGFIIPFSKQLIFCAIFVALVITILTALIVFFKNREVLHET